MNTREIAAEYRLSHWAGIMRDRIESGLSVRAFCEQSGYHENIYYYWQRKLREAACGQIEETQLEVKHTNLAAPGFSEVRIAKPSIPKPTQQGQLRVEVGGITITADNSYPTEKLAWLLSELVRTC